MIDGGGSSGLETVYTTPIYLRVSGLDSGPEGEPLTIRSVPLLWEHEGIKVDL